MSGETETRPSGWTVDTLKEHLEDKIAALDRVLTLTQGEAKRAVTLADAETERRLALLNEFRNQSADEQQRFLPRETFDQFVLGFTEYKDATSKALTLREGQSRGTASTVSMIFAGGGFLLVVISIVLIVGDVLTP